MASVVRAVGAIVAGMLLAFILVVGVELFSAVVHPLPADFNSESMEDMCEHVARYPAWVLAVVVAAWWSIAFAGTWTAGRLGNQGSALVVGLLLLTAVLFNISKLPYPVWFKTVIVMGIPLAIALGFHSSRSRSLSALKESD